MKSTLARIYRWEYFWLCLIVIATLVMHFVIIDRPDQVVFDETHYVKDARSIITDNVDQRPEHPPLGKLFVVVGIDAFGDNPWGWRIPSIVMGTISIGLFFFICRKLGLSRRANNVATFLFAFENMTFLQASMAMLDIFFLPFMLGFFLLYLYRNYFLSGVFVGLAAVAKLFAAMATPTVFIHWLFSRTKPSRWFIATMVMAPVSFIAFIPLFDFAITHQIHNPISRIKEMLSLSGSLTFANTTHPALSRPWDWLLSPVSGTAYWYGPFSTNWVGGYTGVVSPTVWGLMIPVVLYLIYRAVKRDDAGLFASAWFFGTFLLWIPISIITDRVSFAYYFYPTVGALCIGLGLAINQIMGWVQAKRLRIKIPVYSGLGVYFLAHIASLVVLTPLLLLIMGK